MIILSQIAMKRAASDGRRIGGWGNCRNVCKIVCG